MLEKVGGKIWNLLSRFIIFMVNLLLTPFHKKLTDKQAAAFLQFCKFAIVGVSNTLVSMAINFCVLFACGKFGWFTASNQVKYQAFIGNTVAFFLSVLWSFYWNNRFVFKEDENGEKRVWWKTLIKTYLAYAFTGLGLSNLISWLCIDMWRINKYIAVLINLVLAVPINYVLNKFWAYGQKGQKAQEKTEVS